MPIIPKHRGLRPDEIEAYFRIKGSTVSQLRRRLRYTINEDQELGDILSKIEKESLLKIET